MSSADDAPKGEMITEKSSVENEVRVMSQTYFRICESGRLESWRSKRIARIFCASGESLEPRLTAKLTPLRVGSSSIVSFSIARMRKKSSASSNDDWSSAILGIIIRSNLFLTETNCGLALSAVAASSEASSSTVGTCNSHWLSTCESISARVLS